MASLSKQSSAGKPKLERRDAKKIDYRPSDSPRSAAVPFRALEKNQSFRVLGFDSKGEIDKICEELGLAGGADAFSIPPDAWEAGKAKSNSINFIRDQQTRSKSLDEPPGSLFARRGTGRRDSELPSSPFSNPRSLSPSRVSPFYNSMSSSSGDSFASDSSLCTGEKGFFGSLDPPREPVPLSIEPRQRNDRQQPANVIQRVSDYGNHETPYLDDRKQTLNPARRDPQKSYRDYGNHETPYLDDRKQTLNPARHDPQTSYRDDHNRTVLPPVGYDCGRHETPRLLPRKQTGNVTYSLSIQETRPHNIRRIGNEMQRDPRLLAQETRSEIETQLQTLQPPPALHVKSYLPSLSTQELIAGFGPDENDNNDQASDHDDASQSDPEDNEGDAIEEKAEQLGFVSEVLQQHGVSAKEKTLEVDTGTTSPSSLEHSASLISIQSWRKLDMLGSGSFGTVYEGMSEEGVYFAVKEVSLSGNDSKAQQCVTQLEQEIEFLSKFQHENIVRYLGTQKAPDKLYIFLELVTKGSLSSLYQKYTLFESQIRSYTRQILNGLKYLHERKVVHRDIKCANILVDANGKIKVADFGLAKKISQLDELKSCKGSAYWMAPEVIDPKKTYSFPADIWSLGCTVLEMEIRRPPFGDMEWHRALWKVGHGEAPPIPETLSEDAKDFIKRCLEVNPSRRPSARQLLDHPFVQYVGGTGLTPRNSFTHEPVDLAIIAEEKTFDG